MQDEQALSANLISIHLQQVGLVENETFPAPDSK